MTVSQQFIKKQLTNRKTLGIIAFASRDVADVKFNGILAEQQFGLRRNTQEAEEAPLLRV